MEYYRIEFETRSVNHYHDPFTYFATKRIGVSTSCAGIFFFLNCNIFSVLSNIQVKQNGQKQIINLLLLNNFDPATSHTDRVQKESDELLYTAWSLVMVRNQLPTQRATHIENFLVSNCNIFSVFTFKCNPGKTNDKFIAS